MNEYHKINSLWMRDPATKNKTFLEGQWAQPEFEYLANNPWTLTEKVDGTNIRVMIAEEVFDRKITFGGKTDNAQIPSKLVAWLQDKLLSVEGLCKLDKQFPRPCGEVCLYGEGYGAQIQKVGSMYGPNQEFVLFDVKVGRWWLQRSAVEEVAETLGLRVVPILGEATLYAMAEMARRGFKSTWGDFEAEGLVARPKVEMFSRNGSRIITKVKCRDFKM